MIWKFKRWERVLVRDDWDWKNRIYLYTIEWAIRDSYIVVDEEYEEDFLNWKNFDWNSYNEIKRLDEKITLNISKEDYQKIKNILKINN